MTRGLAITFCSLEFGVGGMLLGEEWSEAWKASGSAAGISVIAWTGFRGPTRESVSLSFAWRCFGSLRPSGFGCIDGA